jgi:putative ABC transport system ATP-binding protein
LDYLNIMDNILHPYRITSALELGGGVKQRAVAMAEDIGTGDKPTRMANDLSQGEKQRAAKCRALLPHPKLISFCIA